MQHLTANGPNSTVVYGWDVWDGLSSISRESPKGVKSSSRSFDVTRGNLAWKFERQFGRTDVVFISVCLSRWSARLRDLGHGAAHMFIPELSTFLRCTDVFHTCTAEELLETLVELSTQILGAFGLEKWGEAESSHPTYDDDSWARSMSLFYTR